MRQQRWDDDGAPLSAGERVLFEQIEMSYNASPGAERHRGPLVMASVAIVALATVAVGLVISTWLAFVGFVVLVGAVESLTRHARAAQLWSTIRRHLGVG